MASMARRKNWMDWSWLLMAPYCSLFSRHSIHCIALHFTVHCTLHTALKYTGMARGQIEWIEVDCWWPPAAASLASTPSTALHCISLYCTLHVGRWVFYNWQQMMMSSPPRHWKNIALRKNRDALWLTIQILHNERQTNFKKSLLLTITWNRF